MDNSYACTLESLKDVETIIPIGEEKMFLGRSLETKIIHPNCSKKQICVKANLEKGYVLVKNLGMNKSAINGFALETNTAYEAADGDIIELLQNDCFFRVNMKRKNSNGLEEKHEQPIAKKIKIDKEPESEEIVQKENIWKEYGKGDLFVYTAKNVKSSVKIASYDIDGTIIKTKSGNVFPKNTDDWQIAFNEVPGKLSSLHKDGFKLVFFTNQAGISKGKLKIDDFKTKVQNILSRLNVPVQVFVSTGKGEYRKPMMGMWKKLQELNGDKEINKIKSFFIGDAAGRPEIKQPVKRKKDHSCSDRLFAMNVGISFFTPEQHFQNSKYAEWVKPEFDPTTAVYSKNISDDKKFQLLSTDTEVILMVGSPASGKSHFTREHLVKNSYVAINRDKLGNWQKCVQVMEDALKDKKSVVIDNTNPDKESRKRYIDVAKKLKIPVRCFVMNTTYKQARHNNAFRELTDKSHSKINDMIFNMYKTKYQEPEMKEGFTEINKVNFVPNFQNDEEEKLYRTYLLESY